jgi:acetyl esterase/lipase
MKKPLANVPAVPEALAQGWAIVATDYVGLGTVGGHAYLVGPEAARGVLDSVRAARQMQGVTLADSFVVWGHSQGGNSALWTGQLASQLAPDLQLKGTAAFAPASDLKSLVSVLGGSAFSKIVSAYLIKAYGQAYPDVAAEDYGIKSSPWLVDDIANRCVGDLGTLFSVAEAALLPATGLFAKDPTQGTLAQRLSENTPNGPFDRPVFVAQGDMDDLISPKLQQAYVASLCATGQPARLKEYPGLDHISLVAPQSPLTADLIDWTRERFAGGHPGQGC